MKILNKIMKFVAVLLIILVQFVLVPRSRVAYAATSPGLGQAASFAVLAGTAITNVPTSVITGDVGLSPAAGSNYAGLTNLEVSGTIYAPDDFGPAGTAGNNSAMLTTAKTDLTAAYDALSAAPNDTCDVTYAGTKDLVGAENPPDSGGLVAGVYCANAFTLSGTLTLNGAGVWIFRSAATLITSDTANVVGGDACNVWWKVVSSATLGTNTQLTGNILALTSITMNTGATLNGRALARNGAVTLQSNTINNSCAGTLAKIYPIPTSVPAGVGSGSAPAAKICPNLTCVTPVVIESKRVSADSIFISWGPYAGINTFNIRYGLENGKWLYSTTVTGFSTTIHALPANQPIWVLIEPTDSCSIGPCGVATLVGGPALPNTGLASSKNTVPWYTRMLFFIQNIHI